MDKMICTNIFFNFWLKLYSVWKNARLLKLNCYLLFTVGSRAAKCSWFGPYTILCALRDCFILHEPWVLIVFKDCLLFTFILMSFWSLIAYWLAIFFFLHVLYLPLNYNCYKNDDIVDNWSCMTWLSHGSRCRTLRDICPKDKVSLSLVLWLKTGP